MLALGTHFFEDLGMKRGNAVKLVILLTVLIGSPSALRMSFLDNQDWVWAVGLMLSGLFFAIAVIVHGVTNFRQSQLNHEHSNIRIGRWWDLIVTFVVPAEAVLLTMWWLYQSMQWAGAGWLNPFGVDNVGTVLFQFAIVITILVLLNGWLAARNQSQR